MYGRCTVQWGMGTLGTRTIHTLYPLRTSSFSPPAVVHTHTRTHAHSQACRDCREGCGRVDPLLAPRQNGAGGLLTLDESPHLRSLVHPGFLSCRIIGRRPARTVRVEEGRPGQTRARRFRFPYPSPQSHPTHLDGFPVPFHPYSCLVLRHQEPPLPTTCSWVLGCHSPPQNPSTPADSPALLRAQPSLFLPALLLRPRHARTPFCVARAGIHPRQTKHTPESDSGITRQQSDSRCASSLLPRCSIAPYQSVYRITEARRLAAERERQYSRLARRQTPPCPASSL